MKDIFDRELYDGDLVYFKRGKDSLSMCDIGIISPHNTVYYISLDLFRELSEINSNYLNLYFDELSLDCKNYYYYKIENPDEIELEFKNYYNIALSQHLEQISRYKTMKSDLLQGSILDYNGFYYLYLGNFNNLYSIKRNYVTNVYRIEKEKYCADVYYFLLIEVYDLVDIITNKISLEHYVSTHFNFSYFQVFSRLPDNCALLGRLDVSFMYSNLYDMLDNEELLKSYSSVNLSDVLSNSSCVVRYSDILYVFNYNQSN